MVNLELVRSSIYASNSLVRPDRHGKLKGASLHTDLSQPLPTCPLKFPLNNPLPLSPTHSQAIITARALFCVLTTS